MKISNNIWKNLNNFVGGEWTWRNVQRHLPPQVLWATALRPAHFTSISREIFRGVEPSQQSCQNLEEAIEGVCDKKFLSNHPYFSEKVQQLYQMIRYEKKLMDEAI